ncbi:MAG: tRNA (adenosine(37)-N6)-dimethylallyltransferase MiaA [Oligoflexia bacterium]|nr:tRNA (adenosine(37)-N6)-dimethylallyltransferase MiaA [Oligoflexia bacterium]
MTPLLAIAGPTASGKSALAMRCASYLGTDILSIDSVQVYRGFDVGSAKVPAADRARIRHHLIDFTEPNQSFNAGDFVRAADEIISGVQTAQRGLVLCVGTSMYFTALMRGLVTVPSASIEIKRELSETPIEQLYDRLKKVDPERAAELQPRDRARISRALEAFEVAKQPLGKAIAEHRKVADRYGVLCCVLCWSRDELYRRINERVAEMLRAGLVDETRALLAKYGEAAPALKSLGYAQVVECLQGRLDPADLLEEISRETRRYAKRQMTYWRNEPVKRAWQCRPALLDQPTCVDLDPASSPKGRKGFRVLEWEMDEFLERVKMRLAQPIESTEVWYLSAHRLVCK